ncbi:MAG: DUF11 domain-containing protein [Pseudomonadales bacterium]|nr:DUF11 domain-containing protein [Pseudomonadales bacterium]
MKKLMLTMLLSSFASAALAAPNVSLDAKAEVDVEKEIAGVKQIVRIVADDVSPGQEVIYTLTYTNSGDEPANDLELKNPVSQNFHYVNGSAWGEGSEIQFSADGGKTFAAAEQLTVNINGKTQKAATSDYTNVLWKIKTINAGDTGNVGFKAKLN